LESFFGAEARLVSAPRHFSKVSKILIIISKLPITYFFVNFQPTISHLVESVQEVEAMEVVPEPLHQLSDPEPVHVDQDEIDMDTETSHQVISFLYLYPVIYKEFVYIFFKFFPG